MVPADLRTTLDIDDYLAASTDASSRTRRVVFILAVACVLALTGLLNSMQAQWMHLRMLRLGNIGSRYVESKLGPYPSTREFASTDEYNTAVKLYQARYIEFCAAVERAYVENSFLIRVPVFGFTVDVNDLGLVGGFGFLIILACYRFCLSREIDNLRMSFNEASLQGRQKLEEFYKLLAMRQVFTVPKSPYIHRSWFLIATPHIIVWLSPAILLAISYNDLQTKFVGSELGLTHYYFDVGAELVMLGLVSGLAFAVTTRLLRMDEIWRHWWQQIDVQVNAAPESITQRSLNSNEC